MPLTFLGAASLLGGLWGELPILISALRWSPKFALPPYAPALLPALPSKRLCVTLASLARTSGSVEVGAWAF